MKTLAGLAPVLVGLSAPFFVEPATASSFHVPADVPTIAAAIALAVAANDSVLISPGVYYEHDIVVGHGIVVSGTTGHPEDVILDAGGLGRALHVNAPLGWPRFDGFTIRNAAADIGAAMLVDSDNGVDVTNCRFENNHATFSGGALVLVPEGCSFVGCTFQGNSAARGGAAYLDFSGNTTFTGCRFLGNTATIDGGAFHVEFATLVLDSSVVAGNDAPAGGGIQVDRWSILRASHSTLAHNSASVGAAINLPVTQGIRLQTSILAFNVGPAVSCAIDTALVVNCTDMFANTGGDWTAQFAPFQGVNGNISEDPLFCDDPGGDLHVAECSPCVEGATCAASIGALGVGCPPVGICLKTTPPGLLVTADGVSHPSPYGPQWTVGSSHVIGTSSGQVPHVDTRYDYSAWSDGGTQDHNVVVSRQVVTASFDSLFALTTSVTPPSRGAVVPPGGWYTPGTALQLHVQADTGWAPQQWTGSGNGAYTGTGAEANIVTNSPVNEHVDLWQVVPVTVTSTPPGAHVVLGGVSYFAPVTIYWGRGQALSVAADSTQTVAPGTRFRFSSWSDGLARSHVVTLGDQPLQLALTCAWEHQLTFEDAPDVMFVPGDVWRTHGTTVAIRAVPSEGYRLLRWTGTGDGSYTGSTNPTSVTMTGPIREAATLELAGHGYELRISASATDPDVNVGAPSPGPRPLYLWLTCSQTGISALEADLLSDMIIAGFAPSPGVLNAGGPSDLLLAIAACPTGDNVNLVLGSWTVVEGAGGAMCLGPSAHDGIIGAVDCTSPTPAFWPDPLVVGFNSTGALPCSTGANGCHPTPVEPVAIDMSGFAATVGDHMVRLTWSTSFEAHNLGFHVQRRALGEAFRRITTDLVTGTNGAYVYEDHDVVGDRTYEYGVVDVDSSGREIFHGPVSVTTPKWAPIRTGIAALQPNPFVDRVTVRFGLTRPSRATVSVYDVTGRLVRRLVDGVMAPGSHDVEWSGIDANARAVAAGVYFVRFSAPDRTETKKIVRLGHP